MGLKHTVLFTLLATFSEGTFVVSPSTENCTLARPHLTYDGNKITTSLLFTLEKAKPLRVGYFLTKASFEYIGCANDTFLEQQFPSSLKWMAKKDPGSCFYFCGLYFGISKNQCVCLPKDIETIWQTQGNCIIECDDRGIACGGNTYFSLYKINSKVHDHEGDGNCLRVEPLPSVAFVWKECTKNGLRPLCYKELDVYPLNSFNQGSFREAANACFINGSMPTNYEKSNLTDLTGGQIWTGVIRSEAIITDTFRWNYENTEIGVLMFNKGTNYFELSFREDANDVMLSLCDQEETTTSPSDRTVQTTFETTKRDISTTSTKSAFPSETSSKFEVTIDEATISQKTQDEKQSSDVGIAVGISVAVAIIIAVAVIVFVVIRRRKLKAQNNDMAVKHSHVREEEPNEYTDIPENKLATCNSELRYSNVEERDNYAHTYHVLEKDRNIEAESNLKHHEESHYNYPDMTDLIQKKVKDQPTNDSSGQYAHTYFVLEEHQKVVNSVDGTYNVTYAYKPKIGQETDNFYNKLDDKNHDTYDHIRKHEGSASTREGLDNMFASKENALREPCGEPDSVYNHVSGVEESGSYDHVNSVTLANKRGDHVYGIPNKF